MHRFALSAVALSFALPALAAVTPAQFPVLKELEPAPGPGAEVAGFNLDSDMFARLDDGFANLRLYDSTGQETPFWIKRKTRPKYVTQDVTYPAEVVSVHELPGNRIEVILKRDSQQPKPSGIRLVSPVRNFEKEVSVSGSQDREAWKPLLDQELIFDYSRFIDVRNDQVSFETQDYAFYRVEIANITENKESPLVEIVRRTGGKSHPSETEATSFRREPFRIDRVFFVERRQVLTEDEVETRSVPIAAWKSPERAEAGKTVMTFTTQRQPVVGLTFRVRSPNFTRAVTVVGSPGEREGDWQPVASGRITWIQAGQVRQDTTTLVFPAERRCRHYRVTIQNEDNPPLDVQGIDQRENVYETLFLPRKGTQYRVDYGGAGVPAPSYDVATVLSRIPRFTPDAWTAGAETPNPAYKPTGKLRGGKGLLVGAVVLMVAVLLLVIAMAARHVDSAAAKQPQA